MNAFSDSIDLKSKTEFQDKWPIDIYLTTVISVCIALLGFMKISLYSATPTTYHQYGTITGHAYINWYI